MITRRIPPIEPSDAQEGNSSSALRDNVRFSPWSPDMIHAAARLSLGRRDLLVPPPQPLPKPDREDMMEVVAQLSGAAEISPGIRLKDRASPANRAQARTLLMAELQERGVEGQLHTYPTGANVYAPPPFPPTNTSSWARTSTRSETVRARTTTRPARRWSWTRRAT
jgi:hypothetical protein